MTTTWSLVSTMLGVPETVLPCIAHHLNSDAERLHIYLDAPLPQIEAALAAHPRCVVTVCDKAYWAKIPGGRPDGIVRRQLANVEHARRHSSSDWLVHVDSDEFLVSADPSKPLRLGEELEKVPTHHEWVRIAPMERVLPMGSQPNSIFEGVFRRPTNDAELINRVYGRGAGYLHKGMSGHARGKVGWRRGTTLKVRLHDVIWPLAKGVKPKPAYPPSELPPFTRLKAVDLLHFDAWTPLQWTAKLVRLHETGFDAKSHNRGKSILYMAENTDADQRARLYDLVQCLSSEGMQALEDHKLLSKLAFSPEKVTRDTFPEVPMDFRVASFDARLRASNSEFYQRHKI